MIILADTVNRDFFSRRRLQYFHKIYKFHWHIHISSLYFVIYPDFYVSADLGMCSEIFFMMLCIINSYNAGPDYCGQTKSTADALAPCDAPSQYKDRLSQVDPMLKIRRSQDQKARYWLLNISGSLSSAPIHSNCSNRIEQNKIEFFKIIQYVKWSTTL